MKGESDVDILAVCRRAMDDQTKRAVAEQLLLATADCPARGLEFTLYRLDVVSSPPSRADFEINVNGGPGMPQSVQSAELEGARWAKRRWPTPALIDAAVALRHGRPAHLDPAEVDRLLHHVERQLARAITR